MEWLEFFRITGYIALVFGTICTVAVDYIKNKEEKAAEVKLQKGFDNVITRIDDVDSNTIKRLDNLTKRLDDAGLLAEKNKSLATYSFQQMNKNNPSLTLMALRTELENVLKEIGLANKLPVEGKEITMITKQLEESWVLSSSQSQALVELIFLLNDVLKGGEVSQESAKWARDIGPRLLNRLTFKGTNEGQFLAAVIELFNNNPKYIKIERAPEAMRGISFIAYTKDGVHCVRSLAFGAVDDRYNHLEYLQRFIPIMRESPAVQYFIIAGCTVPEYTDAIKVAIRDNLQIRELFRQNKDFHFGVLLVSKNDYGVQAYDEIY